MPAIDIIFVVIVGFALMVLKLFNRLRAMQIQMDVGVVLSVNENPLLFWDRSRIAMFGSRRAARYHLCGVFRPSQPCHELKCVGRIEPKA